MEIFSMEGWYVLLRWFHFLAGITWIGILYYFNFVQTPFFASELGGQAKSAMTRGLVPDALWWFRWGAMFTFLTGWLIVLTKLFHDKTPFTSGYITLILDRNHANFQTAALVAETINSQYRESLSYADEGHAKEEEDLCQAHDAANIRVRIPEVYRNDPVGFASDVLDIKLYEHEPESRVVVNPRAGSIVIGGDVEIGDVVVSHKNIVVEAVVTESFRAIDVDKSNDPKLQELVNQLNALKVPTIDMIEIIRGIDRNGKLHGRLIID